MNTIKNPITGRDKLVIQDDGVYDAITGAKVGIIENGVVKSVYTGAAWAVVVQGEGGDSIDLSFITATAGDILSGKVGADENGNPVVGSIPMRESMTLTPGTKDQTVAAGIYLSGALTVKGDANWTEENIAEGVSMWGKVGTFKGGMEFYKCSSVDTANKSWSGYKAVLTEGVYTFEESITAGLSYTAVTPVIERVYTADALCEIKSLYNGIPVDGLVFYAPLSEAKTTAETGQTLNVSGNPVYEEINGVPCAYFDGSSGLSCYDTRLPEGSNPVSISIWANQKQIQSGYRQLITYGEWSANSAVALCYIDGAIGYGFHTYDCTPFDNSDVGKWHHFLLTSNGEQNRFYIDGNFAGEWIHQRNTVPEQITIGRRDSTDTYFHGFLAGCRIYNRVLTDAEIKKLAGEFEPYAGIVTPYDATANEYGDWKISSLTELHSGHAPWKAFGDFDTGHEWHSDWRGSLSSDNNEWIQWQNTRYMIRVDEYTLVNRSNGGCHALDWTFEGSNDGEHWTVLDTVSRDSASTGESLTRQIPQENRGEYSYHRINITRSDDNYVTIGLITAKGEFTREI